MDEKKLLRRNLQYKTASNKLSQNNIIKINELIQNKIVCTYIPLKLEININSELKGYKELLTTFLDKENINICKYASPFIKNKLNVLQPKDPLVAKSVEVFLTPGLAFTVNGKRLGRGGGYYDRLFSKYPDTLKIGLTSNERILQDIPIEDHDFFMNYVFTNDKYYKSDI